MDWPTLVVVHAVPTLFLAGLIWFVQVVHYPLHAHVGAERLLAYERAHCRRIAPLVLPVMLAELALTACLVVAAPVGPSRGLAIGGAALLVVVWASTFLLQVPCHARLTRRVDTAAMARLVRTNWLRTIAWTLRGTIAVWLLLPGAS